MTKRIILSVFFSCVFTLLNAACIDLYTLCSGKESEVVQFYSTTKPSTAFFSFVSQGVLLNNEGYILVPKVMLEDSENFRAEWKDEEGNLYGLEPLFVSEHPTADAAIMKMDHPNGGKFPDCQPVFKRIKKSEWVVVVHHEVYSLECRYQIGQIVNVHNLSDGSLVGEISVVGHDGLEHGCAVYDLEGEMIGMVFAHMTKSNHLVFQPFFSIKRWIKETIGLE